MNNLLLDNIVQQPETKRRTHVMVVDDDKDLLQLLTIRLKRAGFTVTTENSAESALISLAYAHPDVVVTDLKMQPMDGLGLLTEIEKRFPVMPVILLTAHGTIPDAVAATKKGAFAFLTKPINDNELIHCIQEASVLDNIHKDGTSEPERSQNIQNLTEKSMRWRAHILTRSPIMEELLQQTELAAASDASIIIESESGTGKELLARAIHNASERAGEAFIAVNCTAIPEALFESEMFGHAKGSFTGAYRNHTGLFQQAHKGTLFLDEIGDMPLSFQAKLLRTLQEGSVRPVGLPEVDIDVRIIAATHNNLEEAIERKVFREDLYYRLSVIALALPPLSARREDIPLLADHFLRQFIAKSCDNNKILATGFSTSATKRLMAASWPGNVRQLANVVQQCAVLCRSKLIPESLVDHALRGKSQEIIPLTTARNRFELDYLSSLLQVTDGNVSQAAKLAQRNRTEFYKLLKKYDLNPARFRMSEPMAETNDEQ